MIVTLFICALATPPQDCQYHALRHIELPTHPVTCSMATSIQFLAENADLWDEKTEYPAVVCKQGVRV